MDKEDLQIEWYHGDERKTDFINRNYFDVEDYSRDRNAMGPGIYFTNDKGQASGYAGDQGYVYTVKVNLDPKRTLLDNTKPDIPKLKKFIAKCPDKELLLNYDYNIHRAPEVALKINVESSDTMLEAVSGLYNDLYQKDAVLFAKTMVDIGYDAFYHQVNPEHAPEAFHLIVYNPAIVQILKEEKKGANENLKHLIGYSLFS